jgi:hypothetical protein
MSLREAVNWWERHLREDDLPRITTPLTRTVNTHVALGFAPLSCAVLLDEIFSPVSPAEKAKARRHYWKGVRDALLNKRSD